FHNGDRRRADVFHRPRRAWILPEEFAHAQAPASLDAARCGFADLATVEDDAHAGRALRDGGSRLSRLEFEAPGAGAIAVHHLLVGRNVGTRTNGEPAGLRLQQRDDDVVECGRADIGAAVRLRL